MTTTSTRSNELRLRALESASPPAQSRIIASTCSPGGRHNGCWLLVATSASRARLHRFDEEALKPSSQQSARLSLRQRLRPRRRPGKLCPRSSAQRPPQKCANRVESEIGADCERERVGRINYASHQRLTSGRRGTTHNCKKLVRKRISGPFACVHAN